MITINGQSYTTSTPADPDQALLAATGFGANEVDRLIGSTPDLAAAAARVFISDEVSIGDLAAAIIADPAARDAIRALYAPAVPAPDAA